ncbi:MAG: hypothetical protein AAGC68_16985 [Verrucomicrobiota bacterium]
MKHSSFLGKTGLTRKVFSLARLIDVNRRHEAINIDPSRKVGRYPNGNQSRERKQSTQGGERM